MSLESTIAPVFKEYEAAIVAEDYEKVVKFYHPDAVVVFKNNNASYGHAEILKLFKDYAEKSGTTKSTIHNFKYDGSSDWIVLSAEYTSETEKTGNFKGTFIQIWRKVGSEYLIYHDEFEIVA